MAPHHQLHPLGTKLAGALFHLGKQRSHKQNTGRLIRAAGIFIVRLVFLLLSLGEDDFIHEEENDHRDAAVQNGSADVVDSLFVKNSCDFYTDSKSKTTAKIEPGSSRLFPWVARF